MFHRKPIFVFAILSWALMLPLFFTGCSSAGDNSPTNSAGPNTNSPTSPGSAASPSTSNAPKAKLNINTASGAELLAAIPELGNRMVHEFEEYRPYRSIQQFRKEIGKYVDQAKVAEYEKYIFVPIDHNQSDAPTLQQIPGLDATEAQALIAARPYASRDAFLAKLAEKVSAEELAIAKTYLAQ
jgi:DNA uptake protein ComE-like DNA-binding protein